MASSGKFLGVPLADKVTLGAGATTYYDFGATGCDQLVLGALAATQVYITPTDNAALVHGAIPVAGAGPRTPSAFGFVRDLEPGVEKVVSWGVRKRYVHIRSSVATNITVEGGIGAP